MDERRKAWNDDHELLRELMEQPSQHDQAVEVFLRHHAAVHPGEASAAGVPGPTFSDEALNGLSEAHLRRLPEGVEHSAAWLIWHTARCEDITMNLLVAGSPQVLGPGWSERVCSPIANTANSMTRAEIETFSAAVNIEGLLGYFAAVARRTQEIVQALKPGDFTRRVDPARLRRVWEEGAVAPTETWLTDYWGSRTWAGLLLMAATRHPLVHINEIVKMRRKIRV